MSTVKISQLPLITSLNANTANSLFMGVDIPTGTTGKFTAHTLAQGLYSNEILNVGANPVVLSNTVAQFSGSDGTYLQTNLQNFNANGSADYVATADIGGNSNNFIDVGINNSTFDGGTQYSSMKKLDGYLYVHGSTDTGSDGNLIIGTASTNANIYFIAGNTRAQNIIMTMTKTGLVLNTQSSLTFSDGTTQSSAASPAAYSQAAFAAANTASNNVTIIQGVNTTQNTNITTANNAAFAAFASVNTALQNTSTITVNTNLVVPGTANVSGGVIVNNAGLLQYTTSNNSTVTQLTSKSTTVTCNGRTGQITSNNSSIAKNSTVSFTVNNNQIVSAKDVVIVNLASGGSLNSYDVGIDSITPGAFSVAITNNGSGPLAESLVINYAIIRVN